MTSREKRKFSSFSWSDLEIEYTGSFNNYKLHASFMKVIENTKILLNRLKLLCEHKCHILVIHWKYTSPHCCVSSHVYKALAYAKVMLNPISHLSIPLRAFPKILITMNAKGLYSWFWGKNHDVVSINVSGCKLWKGAQHPEVINNGKICWDAL